MAERWLRAALLAACTLAACDGGDCVQAPPMDWQGTTDRGTAIGCICECGDLVTCYPLEHGCPIGDERQRAHAEVLVDATTYTLTRSQIAELDAVCGSSAPCDSGG